MVRKELWAFCPIPKNGFLGGLSISYIQRAGIFRFFGSHGLFTIYMGKLVGRRFIQMVSKKFQYNENFRSGLELVSFAAARAGVTQRSPSSVA